MTKRFLCTAAGFIAANYIYQAFGGHNWAVANERSFFQAVALAWVWASLTFMPERG